MAKKKKLTPGGPPKGKIIVNSSTWGTHERWARGTHKPAPVNDAFRKAASQLQQANVYARLINNAIKPFNSNIKDGTLWSRLTRHFYSFIESKTPVDFRSLVKPYRPDGSQENFQPDFTKESDDHHVAIHKNCRLDQALIFNDVKMTTDRARKQLQIHVNGIRFNFTDALDDIDAAHVTMIALYVDDRNEYVETHHQAAVLELTETEAYFELPISHNTGVVLLCLKCEAYHKGGISGNLRTKGIDFVRAEALQDIAVPDEIVDSEMIEALASQPGQTAGFEPVAEVETVTKPEEITEPEPVDKVEPIALSEPLNEFEQETKAERVDPSEQPAEVESAVEVELLAEPAEVDKLEPIAQSPQLAHVARAVDEPLDTTERTAGIKQVVEDERFVKPGRVERLQVTQIETAAGVEQMTHSQARAAMADGNGMTAVPENHDGSGTDESNKIRKKKKKDAAPAKVRNEKDIQEVPDPSSQLSLW